MWPALRSAMAVVSPPIPAPIMRIRIVVFFETYGHCHLLCTECDCSRVQPEYGLYILDVKSREVEVKYGEMVGTSRLYMGQC